MILAGMLLVEYAQAQRYDVVPDATLTFDDSSYDRFEPIIVTLTLSNPSSKIQNFGPAAWPGGRSLLSYRLEAPDGELMSTHSMYHDLVQGLSNVSYSPGESHSTTFNLLLSYPIWDQVGSYTLRVFFPDPVDRSPTLIATGDFSVSNPAGLNEGELDTLASAFTTTFTTYPWLDGDSWPEAVIQSAVQNGSFPPYLNEISRYVYALYADLDASLSSGDFAEADSRYAALLSSYPNSVYKRAANQQSSRLAVAGGTASYYNQADSVFFLDLKVALESMSTSLGQSVVPAVNPYGEGPWYYAELGPYWVSDPNAVDWIYVVVVDTVGEDSVVSRAAVPLHADSTAHVRLLKPNPGEYFVVVDHRNHIAVMSDTLVDMTGYYARHDFTTGHAYGNSTPQKVIVSGQDTVYAMFGADAEVDCLVTALDFTKWLAATTAGAAGYQSTDFNFDTQVTALDFTRWLVNTTAGASTGIPDKDPDIQSLICDPQPPPGQLLQQTTTGVGSYIRLNVTKDKPHDFWVDIEAKADSSVLPENTVAAVVVDVLYDASELTLESTDKAALDTYYGNTVQTLEWEGEHFIRVSYWPTENAYPWHDLPTDWEVIHKLYFSRNPPKHDDGTGIRPRSLGIEFFDTHSNIDNDNGVYKPPTEIQ